MAFSLSELVVPHYCCSCGQIGALLCEYCKYNIVSEPFSCCLHCNKPTAANANLCRKHSLPYSLAWCVGEKQQGLEQLVYQYKFDRAKAAYRVFAELLDATLPVLPIDMIVVPVPTISAHIRQRGYDHAALLTKAFAQRRGLAYDTMLVRRSNTVQLGKNRMQRRVQAEQAFEYRKSCDGKRFLIVDDIFTTGATAEFAARTLKAAGAEDVWVAVIAHQPLEKKAPSRYNDEKITTY